MAQRKEVSPFDTGSIPAFLSDQGNIGNENVTSDDLATPQIKVMQPQSPEAMASKEVSPGQLYLTVQDVSFDHLDAINVGFTSSWDVWRKRELGGGKQGSFATRSQAMDSLTVLPGNPDDYDVNQSHCHRLILLKADGSVMTPAVIYLSSTGLSVSQQWNTEILTNYEKAPRYAGVWRISTDVTSNSKGTWYKLSVSHLGHLTQALFTELKPHIDALPAPTQPALA